MPIWGIQHESELEKFCSILRTVGANRRDVGPHRKKDKSLRVTSELADTACPVGWNSDQQCCQNGSAYKAFSIRKLATSLFHMINKRADRTVAARTSWTFPACSINLKDYREIWPGKLNLIRMRTETFKKEALYKKQKNSVLCHIGYEYAGWARHFLFEFV